VVFRGTPGGKGGLERTSHGCWMMFKTLQTHTASLQRSGCPFLPFLQVYFEVILSGACGGGETLITPSPQPHSVRAKKKGGHFSREDPPLFFLLIRQHTT
jgi:hypothetical protein